MKSISVMNKALLIFDNVKSEKLLKKKTRTYFNVKQKILSFACVCVRLHTNVNVYVKSLFLSRYDKRRRESLQETESMREFVYELSSSILFAL